MVALDPAEFVVPGLNPASCTVKSILLFTYLLHERGNTSGSLATRQPPL